jgi:hypothetical protein
MAALALTGVPGFSPMSVFMPTNSLKFVELQRRDRLPEMSRFQAEFQSSAELLEDLSAFREVGFWNGCWAMVSFLQ